jgi:hypothetical protein
VSQSQGTIDKTTVGLPSDAIVDPATWQQLVAQGLD